MNMKRRMDGRWRDSLDPTPEEMRERQEEREAAERAERKKREPIPLDTDEDIWIRHPPMKEAIISVVIRHPDRISEVLLQYIRAQGYQPTDATFEGIRRDVRDVLRVMEKLKQPKRAR